MVTLHYFLNFNNKSEGEFVEGLYSQVMLTSSGETLQC